jgi:hypothetical protein
MERDEKIAFWFLTKLYSDKISPDNVNLLNKMDKQKTMMMAFQVQGYFEDNKLIPKPILDFMKLNRVSPRQLRGYANEMINEDENQISNASEIGKATIKLLLNEIDIINSNQLETEQEENNISESQMKALRRFLGRS